MSQASEIQIEGAEIPWMVTRSPRGLWIGKCESLNLAVQSQTWQELMEDIGASIDLLLQDLVESGSLEQFFADKGWTVELPPDALEDHNLRFDIPFLPTLENLSNDRSQAVPA